MKIYLMCIIISSLFGNEFNYVKNNELQYDDDFDFTAFVQAVNPKKIKKLSFFSAGSNSSDINDFGSSFKTKFQVSSATNRNVFLESDDGEQILVNKDNYDEFRQRFFRTKCLRYKNDFPVKFFKVKTRAETKDLLFTDNAKNGNKVDSVRFNSLIYYAYAHREIGNSKYVLLGTTKEFLSNPEGLAKILGWVRYMQNKEKQSVVLWNTNIGVRPLTKGLNQDREPLVFRNSKVGSKASDDYVNHGNVSKNNKHMLVDPSGINNIRNQFHLKNEKIHRWLPIYVMDYDMSVGVLGDIGNIVSDLNAFITTDEIQIAFIIDATASMTYVWEKLDKVIIQVLDNILSSNLKNAIGKKISPKIKIYYYNKYPYILSSKWIKNKYDLQSIKSDILDITCISSDYVRPPMSEAIELAIENIGNNPTYMVVIGDAGDKRFPGVDLASTKLFKQYTSKENLNNYHLKGVRFDSGVIANGQIYVNAYDEFSQNFPILGDFSNYYGIESASRQISEAIVSDISTLIGQLTIMMTGGLRTLDGVKTLSPFSKNYLEEISNLDLSGGDGTFFEEGIIVHKDSHDRDLLNIDVFISLEKLEQIQYALQEYVEVMSISGARTLIIKILAAFFEIDAYDVDREFLEKTTIEDLWLSIVGDLEIAKALLPGIFESNITFENFLDKLNRYEDKLNQNAQNMNVSLYKYSIEHKAEFITDYDLKAKSKETNYWVNSNHLFLFKGMKF